MEDVQTLDEYRSDDEVGWEDEIGDGVVIGSNWSR